MKAQKHPVSRSLQPPSQSWDPSQSWNPRWLEGKEAAMRAAPLSSQEDTVTGRVQKVRHNQKEETPEIIHANTNPPTLTRLRITAYKTPRVALLLA